MNEPRRKFRAQDLRRTEGEGLDSLILSESCGAPGLSGLKGQMRPVFYLWHIFDINICPPVARKAESPMLSILEHV